MTISFKDSVREQLNKKTKRTRSDGSATIYKEKRWSEPDESQHDPQVFDPERPPSEYTQREIKKAKRISQLANKHMVHRETTKDKLMHCAAVASQLLSHIQYVLDNQVLLDPTQLNNFKAAAHVLKNIRQIEIMEQVAQAKLGAPEEETSNFEFKKIDTKELLDIIKSPKFPEAKEEKDEDDE